MFGAQNGANVLSRLGGSAGSAWSIIYFSSRPFDSVRCSLPTHPQSLSPVGNAREGEGTYFSRYLLLTYPLTYLLTYLS